MSDAQLVIDKYPTIPQGDACKTLI